MRGEPGVLQVRRPAPVLQERLRAADDVRRGEGAGGAPRGLPRLQRLRTELQGGAKGLDIHVQRSCLKWTISFR